MAKESSTSHADTRVYKVVHDVFRLTTTRFADATEKLEASALQQMIRSHWDFYAAVLHHHHHVEDDSLFPALLAVRPDLHELIKTLEDDHRHLAPAIDAVDSAIRVFEQEPDAAHQEAIHDGVVAVRDVFFPHLDIEDEKIIPAIAESIPPKEWDRMDKAALKSIPKEHLPIAVGALDEAIHALPKEARPPAPPPPIRVMLVLSWRKKWSNWVQPLLV